MTPPRMTKQELREDPVMDVIQKGLSFGRDYGRWLALGVGAIVVIAVVVLLIVHGRRVAEINAGAELVQSRAEVATGQWGRARTGLESIISQYGQTQAAGEAYTLLGDVELALQNPEGARVAFEEALSRVEDPTLKAGIRKGLASTYEALGQKMEASRIYEEIVGEEVSDNALTNLMNAGRTARETGDLTRALTLYKRAETMAEKISRNRVAEIQMTIAEIEAKM
ncbi:MAG: tetratricopeptide repeat protein [Candidatus Eisenbacteria bacterium]|uniref:Tetratricopeptide repeat protein n=1 Tax=Eiseniibacteriota bacterium TaxID=2212470 RepID=A0A948W703_UNCEI|nr:tetratricopeptide repeat protein [Candidatus Eisenbacteria bacterium]MBU1949428.1 tetratricopeptide repeat protein [Candidatus Eisenbacteria bacterium]MBU2691690.1 tetratricopeptide repeat protein [Candidatus Eisenbacteria bacterium]